MSWAGRAIRFRLNLPPRRLILALIGAGCIRVGMAVEAAGEACPGHSDSAAGLWVAGGSLTLLALLHWEVRQRQPGMASLFRRYSCGAIAGSLLPAAAGGLSAIAALAVTLAGLALTVSSALLLEWLLRPVHQDGQLPSESMVIARLTALSEVLERAA